LYEGLLGVVIAVSQAALIWKNRNVELPELESV
jgi:hypothetical protein